MNCGFACILAETQSWAGFKRFVTLSEAKWLATLDVSHQRTMPNAIGGDVNFFFAKGSDIGIEK